MLKSRRKINIEYSLVQALYWAGFCACSGFAAVFLKQHGYSNSELGLILAAGNILGFLLSPMLAAYVDRVRRKGLFASNLLLLTMELALVLSFMLRPERGIFMTVGYSLYMACVVCVNPLNTQLCFTLEEQYGHINFGAARSMGSMAYALVSTLMGTLVERLGINTILYTACLFILLQGAMMVLLYLQSRDALPREERSRESSEKSSSLPRFFVENRTFCILMLGVSLLFFAHNLVCSFMINLVVNVGGSTGQMGGINGFMALVELPAMILYDRLSHRVKCAHVLRFAALMFVFKAAAFAMAGSVLGLYAACALQATSFALLVPASVHYVNLYVPHKDSTKGQSVSLAATTLGNVFACSLGGLLYDAISILSVLLIGTAAAALGALICFACTRQALKA